MSRFLRSLTQSETDLTLGQSCGDAKAHLQPRVAQSLLWLAALTTCFLMIGQLSAAISPNSILDRTGLSGSEFFTVLIAESSLLTLLISRHSLLFKCVGATPGAGAGGVLNCSKAGTCTGTHGVYDCTRCILRSATGNTCRCKIS